MNGCEDCCRIAEKVEMVGGDERSFEKKVMKEEGRDEEEKFSSNYLRSVSENFQEPTNPTNEHY